ncbi:MAG: HAD-IC family P-type ATPase [Dietzia sp.]|nr:HAD-IC family P-type ATPase [Dietzia sp.]
MTTATSGTHHGMTAHEVVLLLETDHHAGLTEQEAAARLQRFGPNELPAATGSGALLRLLRQFHHPLIYVLLAAAVVTLVLREYVDAGVILGVVVINAVIGFIQESRAEASLDALRSMVRTSARVVRDGVQRAVDSADLVPGDLVLVEAGDKVPADLRLIEVTELAADESALTGESVPVAKAVPPLPDGTPVADRVNMLYSGTLLTSGSGTGVVVATGASTELGQIHRLVGSAESLATPLTRQLGEFSKVLTVVILGLAAGTFALGLAQGRDVADMFVAAVALAVGAIPEGLPAAVTITLAIGVSRMARRRAVVRRLPAVETLGSTTVICSDKTGTLTENQMTVRTVWTPDRRFAVTGSGYDPHGRVETPDGEPVDHHADQALRWSLVAGAACNDARLSRGEDDRPTVIGDPTEGALLTVASKAGLNVDELAERLPRTSTTPFSSERQYMVTVHRDVEHDRYVALCKGATERVLPLCRAALGADGVERPLDAEAVLGVVDELAADGLRVLATAGAEVDGPEAPAEEELAGRLVLTGLQAMLDPPRPAAVEAVRACRTAGIDVKMVTGDHAATATAIAGQLGLLEGQPQPGDVLTGADLEALPDDEYADAVDRAVVLARVTPEQKLRLVRGLQARRNVVAMTGDGVNDAPALQQADIGIAMGRGGTEVAKEAADMVLTDDEFATIEAAVEEGRGVFDNLTKFIVWTLPTNMGEGLVILVAIVAGGLLPILPTQILWINMTTAVALGLMLAFEPKEPGIMTRPPRDPRRPLLTGDLVTRILLVSALLVAGSWWVFQWELNAGADPATARTAAVNLFVAVETLYLFSCRSLTRPAHTVGLLSNRWLVVGVTVQVLLQAALTYLPVMNRLFQTAPLDAGTWLRIALVAVLAWVVVEIDKHRRARGLALTTRR